MEKEGPSHRGIYAVQESLIEKKYINQYIKKCMTDTTSGLMRWLFDKVSMGRYLNRSQVNPVCIWMRR